ncbi:hypothetical protein M728_000360 [Ensifer sp. WSM1721]
MMFPEQGTGLLLPTGDLATWQGRARTGRVPAFSLLSAYACGPPELMG